MLLAFWRPGPAGWAAILVAFTVIALAYGALGLLLGVLVKSERWLPGTAGPLPSCRRLMPGAAAQSAGDQQAASGSARIPRLLGLA